MIPAPPRPTWRKPAGMFAILALILVWIVGVASLSPWVGAWPGVAQLAFYVVTGVIWILPLKPLLRWMETGRWRSPQA
jgi:membrane protein YdbS with pleckstrin-like domain